MKKLTKIRYKDGETTITWLDDAGDRPTVHKHELVSKEGPEPEFLQALDALTPHVLKLLELPPDYVGVDNFVVQGVNLSYDKDDRTRVVVTCLRALLGADSPLVLNTPGLQERDIDDGTLCLTPEFEDAINNVRFRAIRFVTGARAQKDLFDAA